MAGPRSFGRVCPQTHVADFSESPETGGMSGSVIKAWLSRKQRKALYSAWFYFVIASLGGILALLPNLGIAFLLGKIFVLVALPTATHVNIWSLILTAPTVIVLFVDCIRAERDDWAVIPLWLAREYFHMGPRVILDGWQGTVRARELARVDAAACAEVLAYLATRTTPTSYVEFQREFPSLVWEEIVPQLRVIEGVILFRSVKSVSLLAPLRLELRQLLAHIPDAEIPSEEPEAIPVDEPQQLSPHEILGVSALASAAEIKTAYRNRVKECHPDRFPNFDAQTRELAEELTKAVNAAYAELSSGGRS
jgi:DnaJ-like protein